MHCIFMLTITLTLTYDLLTLGSMHAKGLPWSTCVLPLVLIAQAVFLLEHGQTPHLINISSNDKGTVKEKKLN